MENKKCKEKAKITFNIPPEEETKIILNKFKNYLTSLNFKNIFEVRNFFCQQYNLFKDYFFEPFITFIFEKLEKDIKIEYLYLLIEIAKELNDNKTYNKISEGELSYLLMFIKEICRCYHYSMNDNFIKLVKEALNKLKEYKIYNDFDINDIIMEFRITTEPKITASENDRNSLINLFNNKLLNIDVDMIDFYKKIESVDRGNINTLRMNLIKKENELIEKQMMLYNKNLEQIKTINELIEIVNKKYPDIK